MAMDRKGGEYSMATIKERNGSFQITVSCGYDINGKHLRETTTFIPGPGLTPKRKQKAVEDFARDFEIKVLNGVTMDGRKITLKEFSDRWFEEYAQQKLQPRTVEAYRYEMKKVLPVIGHLKLTELRPHNLNAFFTAMTKDGVRKDGKHGGYSKNSIAKTQNVLSSILRTATEWEIIQSNPLEKVRVQAEQPAEKLKFLPRSRQLPSWTTLRSPILHFRTQ